MQVGRIGACEADAIGSSGRPLIDSRYAVHEVRKETGFREAFRLQSNADSLVQFDTNVVTLLGSSVAVNLPPATEMGFPLAQFFVPEVT